MFQAAMGWTDSHLHNFRIGDGFHGPLLDDDDEEEEIDERGVTVVEGVEGLDAFDYEYDFGDGWSTGSSSKR